MGIAPVGASLVPQQHTIILGTAKGLCTNAGCRRRCIPDPLRMQQEHAALSSLFSTPWVMCNGAYFSFGSGLLLCKPEACSLPAAPEHKRQKYPKVSFMPRFCLENGNIPQQIGHIRAMPLLKSTMYLLLIPHFFFLILAEDPLSNTFEGALLTHKPLLPASFHPSSLHLTQAAGFPLCFPLHAKIRRGVRRLCHIH